MIVAVLSPDAIGNILGGTSGWIGVIVAAVIGSVALIPAFVAFPLAAILHQNGAGFMQLSAFVSTLTMVGVLTFPLEIKFFGKKFTVIRNALSFALAFAVAFVIGKAVV